MNTRLLRKRREKPAHPVWRALRVATGALVLMAGIFLAIPFIPGPGVVLILVGLWIVSADIRLARRALMRVRISLRRARRNYRKYRDRREDGGNDRLQ
jgi:UPF0716 family protein affecting phage T7 exclusion